TPHFNYEDRWQKPVLYYWLTAATYVVTGPTEWSARVWSALSGLGLVLLTWAAARRMTGRLDAAWLAGAITATSYGYFAMARAALVFAAIGLPWYVAMTATHGMPYLESFFLADNLERFATDRFNEPRPLWFYVPIIIGGLLPWSGYLLALFWRSIRDVWQR